MNWLVGLSLGVSLIVLQSTTQEEASPEVSVAAPEAAVPVAPEPIPQIDPGEDLTHLRCTSCHAASRFTSQHRTADNWEEVIDRMISHGARVSAEEYPFIHGFLTRTQGPLPTVEALELTNAVQ